MSFYVYRVTLRTDCWNCPKFRKRNAEVLQQSENRAASRSAFYVGSTGQRVSRRVQSHMLGNPDLGGFNVVRRWGLPSPNPTGVAYEVLYEYETRQEAEKAEQDYAAELRSVGIGVWVNRPRR